MVSICVAADFETCAHMSFMIAAHNQLQLEIYTLAASLRGKSEAAHHFAMLFNQQPIRNLG